jgi:hypothetical protein
MIRKGVTGWITATAASEARITINQHSAVLSVDDTLLPESGKDVAWRLGM